MGYIVLPFLENVKFKLINLFANLIYCIRIIFKTWDNLNFVNNSKDTLQNLSFTNLSV